MRRLLPALVTVPPTPALARSDARPWRSGGASGPVSGPVQASVDTIARHGEQACGPYRWNAAAALGYAMRKGVVATRLRSERRWRDNARDTGTHGRLRISWTRPLRSGGGPSLVLSHASFVHVDHTDRGQVSGYDRMRNASRCRCRCCRK